MREEIEMFRKESIKEKRRQAQVATNTKNASRIEKLIDQQSEQLTDIREELQVVKNMFNPQTVRL